MILNEIGSYPRSNRYRVPRKIQVFKQDEAIAKNVDVAFNG